MDQRSYAGIIKNWLEYIRLEEFNNVQLKEGRGGLTTLPAATVKNNKLILDTAHLHKIVQMLPPEYRKGGDTGGSFPDDLYLLFPLLECTGEGNQKLFLPVGAINISRHLQKVVQQQDAEIDLEEEWQNYGCISTVLTKACSYEDFEVEALQLASGLYSFAESLTGDKAETIEQATKLTSQALAARIMGRYHVSADVAIARLSLAEYSQRMQADLREILHAEIPEKGTLARTYLERTTQDKLPEIARPYWHGQFHKNHLMGQGQAESLAHQHNKTQLLAVQGPPGTGKTTLALNAIAGEVVARTTGMVMSGKDAWFSTGLTLVVSDTNKALENVADSMKTRFAGTPLLLFEAGSQARNAKELARLERAEAWLTETDYDHQRQNLLRNEIIRIIINLEDAFNSRQSAHSELALLQQQIAEHAKNIKALESEVVAKTNEAEAIRLGRTGEEDARAIAVAINEIRSAGNATTPLRQLVGKITGAADEKLKILKKNYSAKIFTLTGLVVSPENLDTILNVVNEWRLAFAEKRRLLDDIELLQQKIRGIASEKDRLYQIFLKNASRAGDLADYLRAYRDSSAIAQSNTQLFELSVEYLRYEALKLRDQVQEAIECFRSVVLNDRNASESAKRLYTGERPLISLLTLIYPVVTSTLNSIRNLIPTTTVRPAELVIADESGMIQCHKLFPALLRGHRALVVGDPKQLPAVATLVMQQRLAYQKLWTNSGFSVDEFRNFAPTETTAFHRAAGTNRSSKQEEGAALFLEEHRRCASDIAETFIQVGGYQRLTLHASTDEHKKYLESKHLRCALMGYQCNSSSFELENDQEIDSISRLLRLLESNNVDLKSDVAVITPFRRQEGALIKKLVYRDTLLTSRQIGTVHKFQGQEFPIVIFSPCVSRISQKSVAFVGDPPNLLNVAISRAQHLFIVVGNLHLMTETGGVLAALTTNIASRGLVLDGNATKPPAFSDSTANIAGTIEGVGHLLFLDYACRTARKEIFISTTGLRGEIARRFLGTLKELQNRGIKGWLFVNHSRDTRDQCLVDEDLLGKFRELLGNRLVLLNNDIAPHQQTIMVDTSIITTGNFDWLHHSDSLLADYRTVLSRCLTQLNFDEGFNLLNSSFNRIAAKDDVGRLLIGKTLGIRQDQSTFTTQRTTMIKQREFFIDLASKHGL